MSASIPPQLEHLYNARNGSINYEKAIKHIDGQVERLKELLESDFDPSKPAFTQRDKMLTYTLVYKMCTQNYPENYTASLYDKHRMIFEQYLENTVYPALKELQGLDLIKQVNRRWDYHCIMNRWMFKLFYYVDRYHCVQNNIESLTQQGDEQFRRYIFERTKLRLAKAFHEQVMEDRKGNSVDRSALNKLSNLFVKMSRSDNNEYVEHLERGVLKELGEYARSVATTWINEESAPSYLSKTEDFFLGEVIRVEEYFQPSTEEKLLRMLEEEFLQKQKETLLEKSTGIKFMLENDKSQDLSRMFRLFRRIKDGLESIAGYVRDHIQELGMEIVRQREQMALSDKKKDTNVDVDFVKRLLELLDEWRKKVTIIFEGHNLFQKALKDAFEVFVNTEVKSKHSNTELIATYCDQILRGGGHLTEQQMEDELQRIIHLFTYIIDKDRFSEIYRNQLGKRLLSNRSASKDAEKSMISKLKLRCGAQFTSKHEGMLRDLEQGVQQMEEFATWRDRQFGLGENGAFGGIPQFEFNVRVLTTGWWPSFTNVSVRLPDIFEKCQKAYEQFYYQNSQNRKLTWQNSEGTAVLKASFGQTYEITVTTIQAAILLFFGDHESEEMGLKDVCKRTEMEEDVGKRVLHSLSCGNKFKIIKKQPQGRTISTSDSFKLDEEFSSHLRRFRIPMAALEEPHNPKKVEDDRRTAVDAAIVRIMKTRQRMKHHDLVGEVLRQLQFFNPDAKVIKRRIEYCISNDYMERDPEDVNVYTYVA